MNKYIKVLTMCLALSSNLITAPALAQSKMQSVSKSKKTLTVKSKSRKSRLTRYKTSPSRHSLSSRGLSVGQVISMTATAYYPGGGIQGGHLTATGHRVRRGIIAVDPRIIPLYTRVYVEGYGEAIALDTGGAIKGHKIDLAMETHRQAYGWGRRKVKITILGN